MKAWDLKALGTAHKAAVRSVAFCPGGEFVVSVATDESVKVWDVASGREVQEFRAPGKFASLQVAARAKVAVGVFLSESWMDGYGVEVFDLVSRRDRQCFAPRDFSFHRATVTDDARYLAVSSSSTELYTVGNVTILDLDYGGMCNAGRVIEGGFSAIAAVPGTHKVLLSSTNAKSSYLTLWDIDASRCEEPFACHEDSVTHLVLSEDGRFALSGSQEALILWDLHLRDARVRLPGHSAGISSLAMTPDARMAISCANDGTVRIWDLAARREFRVIERKVQYIGHTFNGAYDVGLTFDGVYAVLIRPTEVEVVRVSTGETQTTFPFTWIISATFDPASLTVAVGEETGEVYLLRLNQR